MAKHSLRTELFQHSYELDCQNAEATFRLLHNLLGGYQLYPFLSLGMPLKHFFGGSEAFQRLWYAAIDSNHVNDGADLFG